MATKQYRLSVTLTPEEREHIDELAGKLHLNRSEVVRRVVLAKRLPDATDFVAWQGIRDLMKVNADLARLGNLFKLALDEEPPESLIERLEVLAAEIAETQQHLKAAALEIRALVQRGRA
ncbi:plasmid mobilization protein [Tepidicaulis sp.]|uniref:plasmid mobilization protein n=1 Tax=Tepidicaulis sp. TaxID=1920809 RepID=UPI003B5A79B1